jgi:hypothetical protein
MSFDGHFTKIIYSQNSKVSEMICSQETSQSSSKKCLLLTADNFISVTVVYYAGFLQERALFKLRVMNLCDTALHQYHR